MGFSKIQVNLAPQGALDGEIMCECNICKNTRGEITDKELEQCLKNDIKRFKKIVADKTETEEERKYAGYNIDEANMILGELQEKNTLTNKRKTR